MDDLEKDIEYVRKPWIKSSYYADAEKWTFLFWEHSRPFRQLFEQIPKGNLIELACGHGRHAEQCAPLVKHLTLVDVVEENIDICRSRLSSFSNLSFKLGTGAAFPDTEESSVDGIYCYDAMVHFEPTVVEAYLADTARVLKSGGRALYHHSNFGEGKGKIWGQNPHARNFMTKDMMADLARSKGLDVIEQRVIGWGGVDQLDCITLVGMA
jgi:ubiquinone/menaquinone biosynthesis C-methylase UbiE